MYVDSISSAILEANGNSDFIVRNKSIVKNITNDNFVQGDSGVADYSISRGYGEQGIASFLKIQIPSLAKGIFISLDRSDVSVNATLRITQRDVVGSTYYTYDVTKLRDELYIERKSNCVELQIYVFLNKSYNGTLKIAINNLAFSIGKTDTNSEFSIWCK